MSYSCEALKGRTSARPPGRVLLCLLNSFFRSLAVPGKMKRPTSWTYILNLRPSSFKTFFFFLSLSSTVTRRWEAKSSLCLHCLATILFFKPRFPWSQRFGDTCARPAFVLCVPLSICWHITKRGNCVQALSSALWILSSQASPRHACSKRPIYLYSSHDLCQSLSVCV